MPGASPTGNMTTAERIRQNAPQQSRATSAAARPGMRAAEAVALVQSMAASPSHPATHADDLAKLSPLISMFAAGLAPQGSSLAGPGASADMLRSLALSLPPAREQSQPGVAAGLNTTEPTPPRHHGLSDGPNFSAIFRSPLAAADASAGTSQRAPVKQPTPAAPQAPPPTPPAAHPHERNPHATEAQSRLQSSDAGAGSPQLDSQGAACSSSGNDDEAFLDVLTAVMDAWETALTQRLNAAVAAAVAEARRDVLRVRTVYHVAIACLGFLVVWRFCGLGSETAYPSCSAAKNTGQPLRSCAAAQLLCMLS